MKRAMLRWWAAQQGSVGNDAAEKFASKSQDDNNCEVYTFDTVELVRHRLGPRALPKRVHAALGLILEDEEE